VVATHLNSKGNHQNHQSDDRRGERKQKYDNKGEKKSISITYLHCCGCEWQSIQIQKVIIRTIRAKKEEEKENRNRQQRRKEINQCKASAFLWM
jgi:hypothetical protein